MSDLKPCPFCGGEAGIGGDADGAFVNCKRCLAATDHLSTARDPSEAAAIAAWNRRADDWQPIETAPENRLVLVWASPRDDLPGFVTIAQWNEWGGWCVDELRHTTHWRPLPKGPGG